MKSVTRILQVLTLAMISVVSMAQVRPLYNLQTYTPNDGGILTRITPSGKFGIVALGNSDGGGTAKPKVYDMEKGQALEVLYNGSAIDVEDVSDDGKIVVGSYMGRPVAYNRATSKLTTFPMRPRWVYGTLNRITPDGKWAVGFYNGYTGSSTDPDTDNSLCYSTLYVNVETGDTIATPGLPRRDMAHQNQNAIIFKGLTPDGRYLVGMMSWFYLTPNAGFTFVYDTQMRTYRVIGFKENSTRDWEPLHENLYNLTDAELSPDGHWLAGMAYITEPLPDSQFYREYGIPYRYDIKTNEITFFDEVDANINSCVVDNTGTVIVNPDTSSPLRDFRILYQDKYWITLSQICQQYYGFDFTERSGFNLTGTICGISGDASRIVAFADPLGESYMFDFAKPLEQVCDQIDLLDNYSIHPSEGSIFSQLSTIEINFGRNVQVIGSGKNVHLYKEDGTKVADGLTAGNQGLQLKTGSKTTVNAVFRTRVLDEGQKYYVTIDAGAVAVAGDATRVNKEIRVNYVGRKDGPVTLLGSVPETHSNVRQFDANSSYLLALFDCPLVVAEQANAYIKRVSDGNVIATLNIAAGTDEETRSMLLLYPSSNVYLYEGEEYAVVIEAGSLTDCTGSEKSANTLIELPFHGCYVRAAENQSVLFYDDFSDPQWSYSNWLRYEGDKRTPTNMMQSWNFDTENFPWQFGMSDDATYADMFAGSHSMYSPAGASDDWMMTPQIVMPESGRVTLSFDAQNYLSSANDVLKVYVFEEDFEIPYISDAWMNDADGIRKNAVLLDQIKLTPGATSENTRGEWTHYTYDLSKWDGKNIYVAFVNQNNNQSAIFLDNVVVERGLVYNLALSTEERVINRDNITVSGQFKVLVDGPVFTTSLVLKDANGAEVSRVEWHNITGSANGEALPFTFPKPLPLQKGKENAYNIDITVGQHHDTYNGSIANMSFKPTKRVVLEEFSGTDCPNCPLGILSIEKCEHAFGDRFIPISIHTYTGDPYTGSLKPYSDALELFAAPSARINRLEEVYKPMTSIGGVYYDTYPSNPLWYDVVAQELDKMALADVSLSARLSEDGKKINFSANLCPAIDCKDRQLSVFTVVLENGLLSYQRNSLGSLSYDVLGEWGSGGKYSASTVYPYIHNDVVRSVIGQSYGGTLGLFPANLNAGTTYTATFSANWPVAISDVHNAYAVVMVLDSQTGEFINAYKTRVLGYDEDAIQDVEMSLPATTAQDGVFTLSGVRVLRGSDAEQLKALPRGVYIVGGKKISVR